MSDFAGMEELLQDFLQEAGELLSDVDNKLVDLEKRPDDKNLLNEIFRGFHTIKGGAGFLNADNLVNLCHRTENLFDKLRNGQLTISPELMDVIMEATGTVRDMFAHLSQSVQPPAADAALLATLDAALAGNVLTHAATTAAAASARTPTAPPPPAPVIAEATAPASGIDDINWDALHAALTGVAPPPRPPPRRWWPRHRHRRPRARHCPYNRQHPRRRPPICPPVARKPAGHPCRACKKRPPSASTPRDWIRSSICPAKSA